MSSPTTRPQLIIHGGAGNITRENLPPDSYTRYATILRSIHRSTSKLLEKGATSLDASTHAVTLFEDCPLFNCGKGAVSRFYGFLGEDVAYLKADEKGRSLREMELLNWKLR